MTWLMLLACNPITSQPISGTLRVGPYQGEALMTSGTVTILDEFLEVFDQTNVESDGSFSVSGPATQTMVAVVEGEGFVPASFLGNLGIGPLEVLDGELFAWSEEAHSQLFEQFGDCARPGGVVTGEMRLFGVTDEQGVSPIIETGFASLVSVDGTATTACYLDASGVYSADANQTGPTGVFGFFGVAPGEYTLLYGYTLSETLALNSEITLVVRENGIVPMFPAWVELPN